MIAATGENVYSSKVEALLAAYPDIKDVGAVGPSHAEWSRGMHAVAILSKGATISGISPVGLAGA